LCGCRYPCDGFRKRSLQPDAAAARSHTPNEAVTTAQHHLKCTVPPHCPHPPSGSHLIPQPRQQLPSPLRAAVDPMSISEQPLSLDGGAKLCRHPIPCAAGFVRGDEGCYKGLLRHLGVIFAVQFVLAPRKIKSCDKGMVCVYWRSWLPASEIQSIATLGTVACLRLARLEESHLFI